MLFRRILLAAIVIFLVSFGVKAQQVEPAGTSPAVETVKGEGKYDPTDEIMYHISNANEFHLFGHYTIPLPCILYSKQDGLKTFMSSVFEHGERAYDRYVSEHGMMRRIIDPNFPKGEVDLETFKGKEGEPEFVENEKHPDGSETGFVQIKGQKYELEKASGLVSPTSFYDFSISKNVFTMLMAAGLLFGLFVTAAKSYVTRKGLAPKGVQSIIEPLVTFIRDDIAKPNIGDHYEKYLPLLLCIFFFVLTLNLFGLVPLAPFGANVTGNLATTAALALIAFVVTNFNATKDYWKHIFWMPGVPVAMKIFLAPIELIGVFTKPVSLMIRLFANITAGHIIIVSLVSLIFVFGNAGKSVIGAVAGTAMAIPFALFLSCIELLVAFVQAYIITMLTASYIGGAIEEHHH